MGDLLITYYSAGIVTIWSKGLRGKFPQIAGDLDTSYTKFNVEYY